MGCDTDAFHPMDPSDPKVMAVRQSLGIGPDDIMILTVGGDAASKGAMEVMQALAINNSKAPPWKYVCKVWPQDRTQIQNQYDHSLANQLGISQNIINVMNRLSRNFMPYLINACDIYAAPSRLEGFGMPQVESGACGKPVIGIKAMGMLDTLVHRETALLAEVAQEILLKETMVFSESVPKERQRIVFPSPRTVDYRASVHDIAEYLMDLMESSDLRRKLGEAARKRVVDQFDYKIVAKRFVDIVSTRLGLS